MSTQQTPAALSDPQWFALAWYGQSVERLCRSAGLACLMSGELAQNRLIELPGVGSGHAVAASPELDAAQLDVVIGGPCIGDCTRYPTVEALYDTLQPVRLAKSLGVPALIYLGDREEALGSGGEGRWSALAERFASWIPGLCQALGCADVLVVRTSSKQHEQALRESQALELQIEGHALDGAFHLGEGPVSQQDALARKVTQRVVAAHLPELVASHLGKKDGARVLMAENLQQTGVFRLARSLASGQPGELHFLGHLPAPSPSARQRMYRASTWDKAPAWELETLAQGSVAGVHEQTSDFFTTWLDAETRGHVAAAARNW